MKPEGPFPELDAAMASRLREAMPTSMSTAELRGLGADVLARSVFTARGVNAIFAAKLKEVVNGIAAGDLSDSQARAALAQTLDALGYDSEKGGFPGEEVPAAMRGTIQDLRSFRRLDLIVRTQRDLMAGAGQQFRGHQAERIAEFPAWELGPSTADDPRIDWDARWVIAGGKVREDGRKIALKGDPVWGELGSYENFDDALGTDHSPFCFGSTRTLIEVSRGECDRLQIVGPNGEAIDEWFAGDVYVMRGKLPLPAPRLSLGGVDPELVEAFKKQTGAVAVADKPAVFDYSDILADEIAHHDAAYGGGGS